jgi:hypothetical protein
VYQAAARLVAVAQPPSLVERLETDAATLPGETRAWAMRAALVAREAAGDANGAQALAEVLTTAYADTPHAATGWAARARMAVATHDELAAVDAYEALTGLHPDAPETTTTGYLVGASFVGESSGVRLSGSAITYAAAQADGARGVEPLHVSVLPNPATATTTVHWSRPSEAGARVEVLDALGRRVAHLTVEAGTHSVALRVAAWPPGVYVARVAEAGGSWAAARFTVLR